jgi:hypothetical protein
MFDRGGQTAPPVDQPDRTGIVMTTTSAEKRTYILEIVIALVILLVFSL